MFLPKRAIIEDEHTRTSKECRNCFGHRVLSNVSSLLHEQHGKAACTGVVRVLEQLLENRESVLVALPEATLELLPDVARRNIVSQLVVASHARERARLLRPLATIVMRRGGLSAGVEVAEGGRSGRGGRPGLPRAMVRAVHVNERGLGTTRHCASRTAPVALAAHLLLPDTL